MVPLNYVESRRRLSSGEFETLKVSQFSDKGGKSADA